MSGPRRERRGYGSVALGIFALTAVAGAAYWYFGRESSFASVWNRPSHRTKRKSVVIVLNQHILNNLPSYDESQSYADLYIICPPVMRERYDEEQLQKKVQHPTRLLVSSTEGGFVHIARHISPDVAILGLEHSWALDQLRGWTGRIICMNPKPDILDVVYNDSIVFTGWTKNQELESVLALGDKS